MSPHQRRGRIYRVPFIAAGAGEWLKRSMEAFNAGMAAGQRNAPKGPVPYRHPELRAMWLSGYEAGSEPEKLFRELRLKGQLPWETINQLPWDGDLCQVFKQGMLAAQQNSDVASSPEQDIVLREFWLAGYEYIKDPERTYNWMREQDRVNLGTPENEIERLQAEIRNMMEREQDS